MQIYAEMKFYFRELKKDEVDSFIDLPGLRALM
jgi:hypothetical protein